MGRWTCKQFLSMGLYTDKLLPRASQGDLWYELLHPVSSGGMMLEVDITANDAMPLCIQ